MIATHILQITQQIGHRFAFVIGEGSFVDAVSRAAAAEAGCDMTPSVDGRQARQTGGYNSTHACSTGPHPGTARNGDLEQARMGELAFRRDLCGGSFRTAEGRSEAVAFDVKVWDGNTDTARDSGCLPHSDPQRVFLVDRAQVGRRGKEVGRGAWEGREDEVAGAH